jgi:surface antigen
VGATVFTVILSAFAPAAHADRFDNQLNKLNQQNAQAVATQQQLGVQAGTLSATIATLQSQIATLTSQIQANQAKMDKLNSDIAANQAELARQRELMAINLRQMYTESDMSTLEMLASSKNLSYFVDREQYRTDIQSKIDATAKRIDQLTKQLEAEKQSVQQMLSDQQSMQTRLNDQRAQTDRLLGLNQNQQAAYNQTIAANNSQIAQLRRQQAAANAQGFTSSVSNVRATPTVRAAATGFSIPARRAAPAPAPAQSSSSFRNVSGTSYPWANASFPDSPVDPWGMYERQCVSYTAWKVASSGRHMPYWGGRGNAKQWDENARSAGIPVDGNPRVGDVAVSNAGAFGHVMYVEAVNGNGTIYVSQYNAGWDGRYSEGTRSIAGLVFIHF